jgi:hypothetical protein
MLPLFTSLAAKTKIERKRLMNYPETNLSISTAVVIGFSFLILSLIAFGWPTARRGETDFRSFYTGARLAGTSHLYSVTSQHAVQREYSDPKVLKAFTRPPFYAVLLWPLGRLPYQQANVDWQALNLIALAGFILLWSPHAFTVILCCWFFPVWVSLARGQDTSLLLFIVSLAVFLLRRKKPFAAGLVFTLCAVKAHLFLLLPLLLVVKRMWRCAAGLLTGGVIAAGVSFVSAGWDWPVRYCELLRLNELAENSVDKMPNLNGLFHGVPYAGLWLVLGTLAVGIATWYAMRESTIQNSMAVVLCGGLLIGIHGYLYDCAFLLPWLLEQAQRSNFGRSVALSAATSVGTLLVASPKIAFLGQLTVVGIFLLAVRTSLLTSTNQPHEK